MNRKVELPRTGNSLFLSVDKYCYIDICLIISRKSLSVKTSLMV